MKTLNITISEAEFNKFGLTKEELSFTELKDLITKESLRQKLNDSIELSAKYKLSEITMAEITAEIKAVRQNAKGRN